MSPGLQLLTWVVGVFAFGALVIAVFGARDPRKAAELWRVYGCTMIIVAAVLVPAALDPLLFAIVVAAAAWRCMFELATTYGARVTALRHCALAGGAGASAWFGAISGMGGSTALWVVSGTVIVATVPLYARACTRPPTGARLWVLSLAFPMLAAAHLARLAGVDNGFLWVCTLYATVEIHDSMAYLFGRLFGTRQILPRLSPGKTAEGAAGGVCCAVAIGAALSYGLLHLRPVAAVALAAMLVSAGICGDLFTSALKRAAAIKDFPAVNRLHGGVLDIYDSTLFAAIPLSLAVWGFGLSA